jgi:hypothetical protein
VEALSENTLARIDKLADEVTHNRLMAALAELESFRHRGAAKLVRLLFRGGSSEEQPAFDTDPSLTLTSPARAARHLNDSQRSAVEAALRARELCMIHGPPGES